MSISNLVTVWWFLTESSLLHFENKKKCFQFPFIIYHTAQHIQRISMSSLKIIFGRVMPNFEKKKKIFSFRSLSFHQLYIFNSNLPYGYVIRIHWSVFEFGHGLMKTDRVIQFLVSVHYIRNGCTHLTQIWYRYILRKRSSRLNLDLVQWIWTQLSLFNVFSFSTHSFMEMYVVIILATNMQYAINIRLKLNYIIALNFV
jgi:hypothetical protein